MFPLTARRMWYMNATFIEVPVCRHSLAAARRPVPQTQSAFAAWIVAQQRR